MRTAVILASLAGVSARFNEVVKKGPFTPFVKSPLPHTYVAPGELPTDWFWGDVEGKSYLTRILNQVRVPDSCVGGPAAGDERQSRVSPCRASTCLFHPLTPTPLLLRYAAHPAV